MIRSYYADIDNTIYEKTSSMNTGIDSILEISKVSSAAGIFTSRILIKFPLAQISSSVLTGNIVNPKYYLNLYQANSTELNPEYTLIAHPVSESWDGGVGVKLDPTAATKFVRLGSSWKYRDRAADN